MCLCMHVCMCTCGGLPRWLFTFIYCDRVFRWIHNLPTLDSQFALGFLAQPSKHQDYRQQLLLPTSVDGFWESNACPHACPRANSPALCYSLNMLHNKLASRLVALQQGCFAFPRAPGGVGTHFCLSWLCVCFWYVVG